MVTNRLEIEGAIESDGSNTAAGGGGSGGSIWIETSLIFGGGVVRVSVTHFVMATR